MSDERCDFCLGRYALEDEYTVTGNHVLCQDLAELRARAETAEALNKAHVVVMEAALAALEEAKAIIAVSANPDGHYYMSEAEEWMEKYGGLK